MLLTLFFVTLVVSSAVALAIWWWLRHRGPALRVAAAAAGGLATACLIWVSTVGFFLAALFEVWPLSLRQGPDTAFSRECYEEFLGAAPPVTVSDVYCRREWGFGGDDINSLRFRFTDRSAVQSIVGRMQLQEVTASERDEGRYLGGPLWWPERTRLWAIRDVYQRRGREFLWVDFETREAFYQQATF